MSIALAIFATTLLLMTPSAVELLVWTGVSVGYVIEKHRNSFDFLSTRDVESSRLLDENALPCTSQKHAATIPDNKSIFNEEQKSFCKSDYRERYNGKCY